jgi:hypothetical protein
VSCSQRTCSQLRMYVEILAAFILPRLVLLHPLHSGILPIDSQPDLEDYSRVLVKRFNEEARWDPRTETNRCVSCLAC